LEEDLSRYVKEQLKPKVPEKREPVPLDVAKKVIGKLNNPPKPKKLHSDYDRTLIKAHHQRNKKCGKTIPQLGTQRKELEPLKVPRMPDLHEAEFPAKTGLTLEQATGVMEDIPITPVVNVPYEHRKPFVTEEEEMFLDTQMFNLHKWYLRMSSNEMKMFGVKYRDHDFFRGEDDFWVYFEDLHHIYHRQALDVSTITIWVL